MKEYLKKIIRPLYYYIKKRLFYIMEFILVADINDFKSIPIIINNRNRYSCLLRLIAFLKQNGYHNIYIIDNASTYPPLLDFYKKCECKIFYLSENVGYLALWETDIYKEFVGHYYVYTDPDVVPIDECPDDFIQYFFKILKSRPFAQKVGFSLQINDIPECYNKKEDVIKHEKQFWVKKNGNYYFAAIDTTFALYRPWAKGPANFYYEHIRTDYPYTARHLPWYVDSSNLSSEDIYYLNNVKSSTHWSNL
jgi:hypothetical protein